MRNPPTMSTPLLRTLLLCTAITMVASTATAQEPIFPWKGGEGRGVRAEHLHMPLTDEENYSDRYTAEAWFEDGTRVWVSFLVTNFGPGTGKMTVRSRWYEADGKEHYTRHVLDRGDYNTGTGPFFVEGANHKLSGVPRRIKVQGKSQAFTFNLTFASGLRPWRPGTGRTTFGEAQETYFDTTLVQPKADVTGWVEKGGAKTQVKGYGYVIHTFGNVAPYNMYKRFLNVRSLDGDTVVYLKEFVTPGRYGNKRVRYLYVARAGEVLVATTRFRLRFGNLETDGRHANRYQVPMEITTTVKRGERIIKIKVVASAIVGREDVLQERSAFEAALIKQYAQPVNYTMDAQVHVAVQEGEDGEPVMSSQECAYEVSHLNK